MGSLLLPDEIAVALTRGHTVLTSNQRAARSLERGFNERMKATRASHWTPANVLSVDNWAATLWSRMLLKGTASRMLLNASQEQAIWREIVAADKESAIGLRSADALAEMASGAWRRLCSYNGHARLRDIGVSTDTKAFQRWAITFERRCRRDDYLSPAQLWQELEAAASRGDLPLQAAGFGLVGFDQIVPALASLFETLRRAGFPVETLQVERGQAVPALFEAADGDTEIRAAAAWIRQRLEADGDAKFAVIVPGMEVRRAEIDRVFREVLAPELQDVAADATAGPYEFSLGSPLASTAMATAGVALLRWAVAGVQPLARVSDLLLSPYFGSPAFDKLGATEFDAFTLRQRKTLRPEMSLEAAIAAVEAAAGLGELAACLRGLRRYAHEERANDATHERSHADWAEAFARMLAAAGWPGRGAVDSVAYQTHQRWQSALDEMAMLDFEGARATPAEALTALERILRQAVFAAESREAPVQLLGPLEAAGQTFNGVWFLGAGELDWPPQNATNSLLPWHTQRELGMPGADAARDMATARAITARIVAAAPEVVFSYAAEIADGRQQVSPLLREMPFHTFSATPAPLRVVPALEAIDDDIALPRLPDRVVGGGAAILQAQAACGFRAFAERRLWATELDTAAPGLDAMERGSLVHAVMELFWGVAEHQERLAAMPVAEREALLDESIETALESKAKKLGASSAWDWAYLETQRLRLRALLLPWLDLELARPAFAVLERELRLKDVAIGPLRLTVQVDRVDETAGGLLIVDYKTGAAGPNDWCGERPDAPQLPLYAAIATAGGTEQLGGVAFALLRAGDDLDLKGYAADPTVLAKSARIDFPTLEDQVEDWRRVLSALAEDFVRGDARVDPKQYPASCGFCAQRLLCRLNPAALNGDDTEAARG